MRWKRLEEHGSPSGEARRVILRVRETSSVLEFGKSGNFSECVSFFNHYFDRSEKRSNGTISTIQAGSGKEMFERILSSFDGATGGRIYNFVVKK